jgi:hypothetical protein
MSSVPSLDTLLSYLPAVSVNGAAGTLTLPIWAAVAFVFLFLVFLLIALARSLFRDPAGLLTKLAILAAVAGLGWLWVQQSGQSAKLQMRAALDERAADLTERALEKDSPLACLDATAGETAEQACERALFSSPQSVAAAASYMAARVRLVQDAALFAAGDPVYGERVEALRRAVELDRYGFVAHVLASRDGCTPDICAAFSALRDTSRLKANMRERAFDANMQRYAGAWAQPRRAGPGTGFDAATNFPPASAPAGQPTGQPLPSDFPLPSANTIPPVSITSPEPPAPRAAPAPRPAQPAQTTQPSRPQQPAQPRPPASAGSPPGNAPLSLQPPRT